MRKILNGDKINKTYDELKELEIIVDKLKNDYDVDSTQNDDFEQLSKIITQLKEKYTDPIQITIKIEEYNKSPDEKKVLEEIAKEAAKNSLLHNSFLLFHNKTKDYENRCSVINEYLNKPSFDVERHEYKIKINDEIIGYALIDAGWDACEMDYSGPFIELAFIHPKYEKFSSNIFKKLDEVKEKTKEDRIY